MKFLRFFSFTVLLVISTCCQFQVLAQNSSNEQKQQGTTTDFTLDLMTNFNNYYFQDPLTGILSKQFYIAGDDLNLQNYILGVSDLITVSIESSQNIVLRALVINPQGDIVIPMLGAVHIADQSIADAENTINNKAKSIFKAPQTSITLEQPKPLVVTVSGNVKYPGKHIIPPFSRVDAAIFGSILDTKQKLTDGFTSEDAAKLLKAGPYSFRNIKIIHGDSTFTADLAAYYWAGDISKNPMVQTGDHIIVNKLTNQSPRVSISGAVHSDMELEYRHTDTPQLLINIAGGFTPEADSSIVYVFRTNGNTIEKLEIEKSKWASFTIKPNDRLIIPTNQRVNTSASAWVYGEVHIPGNFPIRDGKTTALNLLEFSNGLTDQALPDAAYLIRAGSVKNEVPNKFNTELMKRTSDQLAQGLQYLDLETKVSRNKVYIDLNDNEQLSKVKIYDGDRLFIPRDEGTVFVFGQINNPGYYPYIKSGESVFDYIHRAGGFALSADKDRVFIIKAGSGTWFKPGKTELESGDRIFIDRVPYDELNAKRSYEIQKEQIKNTRIQLILTGISTITGIITTYVAIQNIRN
jgi:protein involved in polysaccharide export with SLBB domain